MIVFLKIVKLKIHALILSLIICILASIRPFSLGYDTQSYIYILNTHWFGMLEPTPDIFFNAYTAIYSKIIPAGSASERIYLISLSLIQSILFYNILKNRSLIQSFVMTVGFGPLIFFDIVRQGLAMLVAGALLSNNSKLALLKIFPSLIHNTGLIIFTTLRFKVFSIKIILAAVLIVAIFYLFLYEGAINRYLFYANSDSYLISIDHNIYYEFIYKLSMLNIIVLITFLFGHMLGIFDNKQTIFLIFFYSISILMPIFFRLYIFYIFLLFSNKDIILFRKKNLFRSAFSLSIAIVVLNFASKTNIENLMDLL